MFFELLDRIRQKPRAVREQYAFILTTTFIGIVVFLWLFTLPSRFNEILSVTEDGVSTPATPPFSSLWDQMAGFGETPESAPTPDPEELAGATSSVDEDLGGQLILNPETLEQLRPALNDVATQTAVTAPVPRTVQIATTSAAREAATE